MNHAWNQQVQYDDLIPCSTKFSHETSQRYEPQRGTTAARTYSRRSTSWPRSHPPMTCSGVSRRQRESPGTLSAVEFHCHDSAVAFQRRASLRIVLLGRQAGAQRVRRESGADLGDGRGCVVKGRETGESTLLAHGAPGAGVEDLQDARNGPLSVHVYLIGQANRTLAACMPRPCLCPLQPRERPVHHQRDQHKHLEQEK